VTRRKPDVVMAGRARDRVSAELLAAAEKVKAEVRGFLRGGAFQDSANSRTLSRGLEDEG